MDGPAADVPFGWVAIPFQRILGVDCGESQVPWICPAKQAQAKCC